VDFDKGIITVSKQLIKEKVKHGKHYLGSLKNDKTRRIVPAGYVM